MDRLGESNLDEDRLESAVHPVTRDLLAWIVLPRDLLVPKLRAGTGLGIGTEVLRRIVKIRGALFITMHGIKCKGFADVIHHAAA